MIRPVAAALGGCLRADPVDEALGPGDPYLGADPCLQRGSWEIFAVVG